MNKKLRSGVFETNSSSAHSISLKRREFVFDPLIPDRNGDIIVVQDEYALDDFKFNDSSQKLSYLFSHLGDEDKSKIKIVSDVIYNTTHCNNFDYEEALLENYVDHESVGILNELFDLDYGIAFINIKNFIFNKNYWVFGGSDEETPEGDFYVVKEYTKQEVLEPQFEYEFIYKLHDKHYVEKLYLLSNKRWLLNLDDSELSYSNMIDICSDLMYDYILVLKNSSFYDYVLNIEPLNLNTDSDTLAEGVCSIMLSQNSKIFIIAAFKKFANDLHGEVLKESYKKSFIGNKIKELYDNNYATKEEVKDFYDEFLKLTGNTIKVEFKIKKI